MTTSTEPLPKKPHLYLSLEQVRDSRLLSPQRMAEVEAEIERRISIPRDEAGRPIETARLADLNPWPRMLYPRMDHDRNWLYIRREIMAIVLTEAEREMLERDAFAATRRRKDAEDFGKACKVPASEWQGWVTDGNRYWDCIVTYEDECVDRVKDGEEPYKHRYLWAAKPTQVIIGRDAAGIFEGQMCDRGWEDIGADDFAGWEALQAAIDAFVAQNSGVVTYHEDRSVAVVLEQSATKESQS